MYYIMFWPCPKFLHYNLNANNANSCMIGQVWEIKKSIQGITYFHNKNESQYVSRQFEKNYNNYALFLKFCFSCCYGLANKILEFDKNSNILILIRKNK